MAVSKRAPPGSQAPTKIHIFARRDDNRLVSILTDTEELCLDAGESSPQGCTWEEPFGEVCVGPSIEAVSTKRGSVFVWAVLLDGGCAMAHWNCPLDSEGAWSEDGLALLQGGGDIKSTMRVVQSPSEKLTVLGRDSANLLRVIEQASPGGPFGEWCGFSDEVLEEMALGAVEGGGLVAVVRDTNGDVLHKWTVQLDGGWCDEDWVQIAGPGLCSSAVSLCLIEHEAVLFTVQAGELLYCVWGTGSKCSKWYRFETDT